jgi:hypothetical protein
MRVPRPLVSVCCARRACAFDGGRRDREPDRPQGPRLAAPCGHASTSTASITHAMAARGATRRGCSPGWQPIPEMPRAGGVGRKIRMRCPRGEPSAFHAEAARRPTPEWTIARQLAQCTGAGGRYCRAEQPFTVGAIAVCTTAFHLIASAPACRRGSRRSRAGSCGRASRPPRTSPTAGRAGTWNPPTPRRAPASPTGRYRGR